MITLSNNYIKAKISEHGAELCSLVHNGFEYIWQADKKYWGRHAPILFPIVGKVYNNEYRVGDKKYTLPQHGFARDSEFQLMNATDTEATFMLQSDDETLKVYPYKFELIVTYTLQAKQLNASYIVSNTDDKKIYFQIGGHPAFNYPNWPFQRGYLQLLKDGDPLSEIKVRHPNVEGYITKNIQHIELPNGFLSLRDDILENGALVLENNQCDEISMVKGKGQKHLTVWSDAKLFGIWSPERKSAPFVCLEPWMGRADEVEYQDDFKSRDYINWLEIGEEMRFGYFIEL